MKGLLTKDFLLLLQRKKTFIFLAVWAVVMCFLMEDSTFTVGWTTVITAFFSISSLSYDEYDNCMPFLMSLPVNGKIYAVEKYLFAFLCGITAWIFSALVCFVFLASEGVAFRFIDELLLIAVFIPLFMLVIDITLPLNLKFGSERGRIIFLIIWCVIAVGIFVLSKTQGKAVMVIRTLIKSNRLLPELILTSIIVTAISILISIRIMEKKEY